MRTITVAAAALAAGLGLGAGLGLTGRVSAKEDKPALLGTVRARTFTVSYKMPLDVGADGAWKAPERIDEERIPVLVPELYGELVDTTPHGDGVVLWFRDELGVLRNAVVPNVTTELLEIRRAPTREISTTYR